MDITSYFNEQVLQKLSKTEELNRKISESTGAVNAAVIELEAAIEKLKTHVPEVHLSLLHDDDVTRRFVISVGDLEIHRFSIWGMWAKDGCAHHGTYSNGPYYGIIEKGKYFSTIDELMKMVIAAIVKQLNTLQIIKNA